VDPRRLDGRLLAPTHPHAPDLRVEVHVDLVHKHRRLVRWQMLEQLPEFGQLLLPVRVLRAECRAGSPPHQASRPEPEPPRLPPDLDPIVLPEDDGDCLTTPPVAGEPELGGREGQHPPDHWGRPDVDAGSPPISWPAVDRVHALRLASTSPPADSAEREGQD